VYEVLIALNIETAVLVTNHFCFTRPAEPKFRCRTHLYHRRKG